MSKKHECEFCKKKFTTKSSMNYHQKNTMYCLQLQDKIPYIVCQFCDKNFSSEKTLKIHSSSCFKKIEANIIEKYEEQIKSLKQQLKQQLEQKDKQLKQKDKIIQNLQDKLENIAVQATKRPTNTTYNNRTQVNNIINKLEILDVATLKDHAEHLTLDHIRKGVRGYVDYALEYPLNNRVLCVDYARCKMKYKDENGNITTDPEMTRLSQKFFESIAERNTTLAMQCVDQLAEDIDPEEKMKIMVDMADAMKNVNQSAVGQKNDFTNDFVKGVCGETIAD